MKTAEQTPPTQKPTASTGSISTITNMESNQGDRIRRESLIYPVTGLELEMLKSMWGPSRRKLVDRILKEASLSERRRY